MVTGAVILGVAELSLSLFAGFSPSTTSTTDFTIIDNDDVDDVTGTFAGLAEGAVFNGDGRAFTVSYAGGDDNDVVVTSHGRFIVGTGANEVFDGGSSPAATDLLDVIDGRGGKDSLDGLGGDDTLIGGLGKDFLTGGADADTFVFNSKKDSRKGGGKRDVIDDFSGKKGELDLIDLSAIDAKKGGGNQKFKFIGKKDFHEKKGELHYIKKGGNLIIEGDIKGNGKADFQIQVQDVNKLFADDFIL